MSPTARYFILICAVGGVAAGMGCRGPAGFEAEAALRPGAVYTGPDLSTFSQPIQSLTLGQVAAELRAMVEVNHALADIAGLGGLGGVGTDPSQATQLLSIDTAHTRRLAEIIDVIGWPTERVVGAEASLAAFVIAQQASHDPEFQKRALMLMHDRLAAGKISPQRVAMLTDRVRVQAGRAQVYGTQIRLVRNDHGVLIAQETAPIADPGSLDDRREALGLAPWRHYCRKVADTAQRTAAPRLGRSG